MSRFLYTAVLTPLMLGVLTPPAFGLRMALRTPVQRAVSAEVIVVGKVTAIEKNLIEAPPFPGAPDKVGHRIAVVKIESNLVGAANLTHVKIAFVPPTRPDPRPPQQPQQPGRAIRPIRGPLAALELKEGQEFLFFLNKHPNGNYFIMPAMSPPVDVKGEQGKKELQAVRKVAETIADPMKGLKSDRPAVRVETAAIMVLKHRAYPESARDVEQAAIDAEESKLILRALAEAEWTQIARQDGAPNAYMAFLNLGLTEQDGWKQPVFPKVLPGQPAADFVGIQKKAFTEWLAGPGKNYVVKKFVPKK